MLRTYHQVFYGKKRVRKTALMLCASTRLSANDVVDTFYNLIIKASFSCLQKSYPEELAGAASGPRSSGRNRYMTWYATWSSP